ncbi:MAG: transglycosylase domain-containing protein, partial [Patescibacteria group bacterium]
MPRQKNTQKWFRYFEDIVFKTLVFIVNFFITLGEGTKLIALLPFKILAIVFNHLKYLFKKSAILLKETLKNIFQQLDKLIVSLYKRKIKFNFKNKTKLPRFKLTLPKFKFDFVKSKRIEKLKLIHWRSFFIGIFVSFLIYSTYNAYLFVKELPSPKNIGKTNYSLSTHIFDRHDKLLYNIYRDENRTPVEIEDLDSFVYESVIAIEDKDFFNHKGVSPVGGVFRAIKENLTTDNLQGGSTITQQLVKSALLT